jgi:hypothetical protein
VTRIEEVTNHLSQIGVELTSDTVDKICGELDKITKNAKGCLSVGGSSVRSWIQYWLFKRGVLSTGGTIDDQKDVTCIFHFWPWDVEQFGPQPTENVGTNLDTMRSPTWRVGEANPINRTACKVTGKPMVQA